MFRRVHFLFALSSLVFISCHSILFNEVESNRNIPLSEFTAIKVNGIFNIILIQDSTDRLVISGKNNIGSVIAGIVNDTLVISDNRKLNLNPEKNTLAVHFSSLKYMITYDPVNISCSGILKADHFSYDALGEIAEIRLAVDCNFFQLVNSANTLGNFQLKGRSEYCSFFNRYGSRIFADSLTCLYADITNESIGDVRINASDKITASILGPGDICYYGEPDIEIANKRGDGKMVRLLEN